MATTVNNTTVNSRITIIFDAGGSFNGDGPAKGSGNTESDVYLDNTVHLNMRSHTEVDAVFMLCNGMLQQTQDILNIQTTEIMSISLYLNGQPTLSLDAKHKILGYQHIILLTLGIQMQEQKMIQQQLLLQPQPPFCEKRLSCCTQYYLLSNLCINK